MKTTWTPEAAAKEWMEAIGTYEALGGAFSPFCEALLLAAQEVGLSPEEIADYCSYGRDVRRLMPDRMAWVAMILKTDPEANLWNHAAQKKVLVDFANSREYRRGWKAAKTALQALLDMVSETAVD